MPEPINFNDASAAAEELFQSEQLSLADVPAEEPADVPEEQSVPEATPEASEQQTDVDAAINVAEAAAQTAAEKNTELLRAQEELEALRKQNEQLQGAIAEMSKANEQTVVEEALTPPSIDINALAFATEEEQKAAMAKHNADMSAYIRQEIMKELSPTIEYAKKGMAEKERSDTLDMLSQLPELAGIKEMAPQLDHIIAKNKWLQSEEIPAEEKYINAYMMAKGLESVNNPVSAKEPGTEELLEHYNKNAAFRELVEKQRIEELKKGQQVPLMSAGGGAANVALNIKDKPQTLDEASEQVRKLFGGAF